LNKIKATFRTKLKLFSNKDRPYQYDRFNRVTFSFTADKGVLIIRLGFSKPENLFFFQKLEKNLKIEKKVLI
jgi:hypothetical protein